MSKMFKRIGKDKSELQIKLTINAVEAQCIQPVEMSVIFERGPQRDESKKFPIGPSIKRADVN